MSEKIYFNASNKFSLKRSLVNCTTRLHHTLAPKHAMKTARKVLLTPARLAPKNPTPQGLIKGTVTTSHGKLSTYQLGSGPVWVLTHGWSGSSNQFFPLMEHIASKGYTALAYDHPAHGESEGEVGHIPAFVEGLDTVLDSVDEFAGIIGHSMGTASVLESRHQKAENCPIILVAPVLNYLENLFSSIRRSGYSMRLFNAVVGEVERQYNFPIQSIDPYARLMARKTPCVIVHDIDDKFTPYSVSEKAGEEAERVQLVTTTGQGHGRVMKSPEVMKAFDGLL
ncbi:hypothetical protein VINI7043_03440 [Vibrio nigripulchritudo ATCC 27043]|uniref:Alpha/beta-Hydrolase n=2 Tax=Vibrio nigripulchritudo TaxID=28173 RepID=A0AAV2VHQ2_9VIBR|nr:MULTISPECIES: alpha/beta fold hydrolase [Vibrio]EGU52952.1 hypothetical protein VINI7043_03440 [Vibrio nigripulchritudo ATCC 27043]UAB72767.1 alpha/beta hydrolase [Vibrio sp. SCSIO 43132]CCN81988.1 putative alpha/beta-Hydrolase [Vibrio nigripulchritudo BLFn1]CCN90450.1 putative alpha/beta-Hydrolase [Vibrio nigripulchritudo SFn27]CCN93775.1 putative alpha/beta-Hydrolase [Vibrio nigripulchritudo ENn2]